MVALPMDAWTRHQVYVEGYKDHIEREYGPEVAAILAVARAQLNALTVDRLNELTRTQLNQLVIRISNGQNTRAERFENKLMQELESFSRAEQGLHNRITRVVFPDLSPDVSDTLFGRAAVGSSADDRSRIFKRIANTPDPATGQTVQQAIRAYARHIQDQTRQEIRRAFSNSLTPNQTIRSLFGEQAFDFRNGLGERLRRALNATLRTLVQHISSGAQAAVVSVFTQFYEWAAVLDTGTTQICLSRDGRVYRFGVGPIPPAHYNCRSRIIPLPTSSPVNVPNSFYAWIRTQPGAVQTDILGPALSRLVQSGRARADDVGRFRSRRPLTRQQLAGKFDLIVQ